MAQVDFTNAVLHLPSSNYNPVYRNYLSMAYPTITNSSGISISNNNSHSLLIDKEKKYIISYQGVFTASGTEFYFGATNNINEKWKMTGITFQAGDAYNFQIPVTLTCLNNQLSDVPEDELIPTGD